jgi:hypothetical protein
MISSKTGCLHPAHLSLKFPRWRGICPDERHGLMAPSRPGSLPGSLSASRCLAYLVPCAPSLLFSPIFTAPFLTALVPVIENPSQKCAPSACSANSVRYLAILTLWADFESYDDSCPPTCHFLASSSTFSQPTLPMNPWNSARLWSARGHLLDLANLFTRYSRAVSAVMPPPLTDAGPRRLIQLCHTPSGFR